MTVRERLPSTLALAVLLGFVFACRSNASGPEYSGLPYEVQILSLAVSPNYENDATLLIGTWSGIYRSQDGGTTWAEANKGLERPGLSLPVLDIAFSPAFSRDHHVYAATRVGLMKSTDGGRSWRSVDPTDIHLDVSDTPITDMPAEVAVSPRYPEDARVLAVYRVGLSFDYRTPPERRVIFESTDEGATWTRIGDGGEGIPSYDIQFDSDGAVTGSTGAEVRTRRTPSDPWQTIADFEPTYRVAVLPPDQGHRPVLAGSGFGNSVLLASDAARVSSGFRIGTRTRACLGVQRPAGYAYGPDCLTGFAASAKDERNVVFAVPDEDGLDTRGGIMRSDDGGRTWTRLELPTLERIVAVAVSPGYPDDRTLFAASRSQVFRTTDDGAAWHTKKPACEWDPFFPTSIDWAPVDELRDFVDGRMVIKVQALDYDRVDKDGNVVISKVEILRVLAGDVQPGPAQVRDGFDGHGRCLATGEQYYLILRAETGHRGPGIVRFEMMGHPLTQFAVREGRIVALGSPFWVTGKPNLNGMPESSFVKELEQALRSQ